MINSSNYLCRKLPHFLTCEKGAHESETRHLFRGTRIDPTSLPNEMLNLNVN
jgi:hypothetical protein